MTETTSQTFTKDELAEIRAELAREAATLRNDLADTRSNIDGIVQDSGSAAGDDLADTGSKTFEREQEMFVAEQVSEALSQVLFAIERIDEGTYGTCEDCGLQIGRERLEAYPRATLCMGCKQRRARQD
ncbi:MAG: hypothetical protein RLZ55_202 [Actinomycetota bacterium]|jgi:DnaK suppressor protein